MAKKKPNTDAEVKSGVGVVVCRRDHKVLVGERQGSHGSGINAFPGGHLDAADCRNGLLVGRTGLWVCGEREVYEETGMVVQCFSPDHFREELFTTSDILSEDGTKVFQTSYLLAEYLHGGTQIKKDGKEMVKPLEPEKCKMWHWRTLDELVEMIRTDKQRQWIPLNRVVKYLKDYWELW